MDVETINLPDGCQGSDVQPNALALEYQRDYGTAHGDLNVFDLVNNPAANGKCRIFCLSFPEKGADLFFRDAGSLGDDRTDPSLITQDSDVETINLPDGCQITVDHDAAKQAIPDDVWAEMLKHLKEHGFPKLP